MLALTVLIFTILNGLRLYEIILHWDILKKYNSHPGPEYMSILSLIWFLIGFTLIIGLLKGYSRSFLLTSLAVFFYTIWFWIDQLFLQNSQISYLIPLVVSVFMILFFFILLRCRDTQYYFKQRETHDRQPKN
ncbi:MAG: hypothetical protein A2X25_01765 [Chloroflexi bacterium GWB2_49_20]|nr:MAG: hypothetical protein A2X25_01765 [Chloroflexi bacterium GWB2_49_20]OGN78176.1 MAG: hypothetical protein A2X26_14370 [Chloroflexi bacterium GWC2_49_37]OGN85212.1 MAG: hypothetical protein A2X27_07025 [Chloroflexi bacterium GWD2_49_16]